MRLRRSRPTPSDSSTADSSTAGGRGRGAKRTQLPLWLETILLFVVAIGAAVLLKTFLVQSFYIPSGSMEPGLVVNDRIMVEKPSYWGSGEPQRGDIVVFKDPGGWLGTDAAGPDSALARGLSKIGLYPTGGHLVKRVVAVGGDTVHCCDTEGRLEINGTPINEPYVRPGDCNGPMPQGQQHCDWTAGPVPEDHVFVMGDNRGGSADSTVHLCAPDDTECVPGDEFVSVDLVVGKVFSVLWPADHFRWVKRPDSFDDVPNASAGAPGKVGPDSAE